MPIEEEGTKCLVCGERFNMLKKRAEHYPDMCRRCEEQPAHVVDSEEVEEAQIELVFTLITLH